MASACAPPAACTSVTPSSAHAASTEGCGNPPYRACGGDATAIEPTPAAGRPRGDPGGDLGRDLRAMHLPGAADGLRQRGPDVRVEPGQGRVQGLWRHPGRGQVDTVEAHGVFTDSLGTTAPDVLTDGPDLRDGGLDIGSGAWQDGGQGGSAETRPGAPAPRHTGNHPLSLRRVPSLRSACPHAGHIRAGRIRAVRSGGPRGAALGHQDHGGGEHRPERERALGPEPERGVEEGSVLARRKQVVIGPQADILPDPEREHGGRDRAENQPGRRDPARTADQEAVAEDAGDQSARHGDRAEPDVGDDKGAALRVHELGFAARYLLKYGPRRHRRPDEPGHDAEQRTARECRHEHGKPLLRRSSLIAGSLPRDGTGQDRAGPVLANTAACICGRIDAMASKVTSSQDWRGETSTWSIPSAASSARWLSRSASPAWRSSPSSRAVVTVFSISAWSRPAASQWSRSTRSLCSRSSWKLLLRMSNRLQASAYLATRRSVLRSPLPPIRIGGCGRCRELGELSGRTSW